MKNVIILIAFVLISHIASCQDGEFNFSIGAGVAAVDDGVFPALAFEPKVRASDNVRIGGVAKIALGTRFRAFYADLNVKPSSGKDFYLGIGIGNSTYYGVEIGSGFTSSSTKESGLTIIPSFGVQGSFDFNLSAYFVQEVTGITLTVSRVIGYKKPSSE